jgi:hypothetical protein
MNNIINIFMIIVLISIKYYHIYNINQLLPKINVREYYKLIFIIEGNVYFYVMLFLIKINNDFF